MDQSLAAAPERAAAPVGVGRPPGSRRSLGRRGAATGLLVGGLLIAFGSGFWPWRYCSSMPCDSIAAFGVLATESAIDLGFGIASLWAGLWLAWLGLLTRRRRGRLAVRREAIVAAVASATVGLAGIVTYQLMPINGRLGEGSHLLVVGGITAAFAAWGLVPPSRGVAERKRAWAVGLLIFAAVLGMLIIVWGSSFRGIPAPTPLALALVMLGLAVAVWPGSGDNRFLGACLTTVLYAGVTFAGSATGMLDARWVALSPLVLVLFLGIERFMAYAAPRPARDSTGAAVARQRLSRSLVAAGLVVAVGATASVAARLAGLAEPIALGDEPRSAEFVDARLLAIGIATVIIIALVMRAKERRMIRHV